MGELTDFEEIRRRRKKSRLKGRIISISLLGAIIVSGVLLWRNFGDVNIIAYINNFFSQMNSGSGYPLELPADEVLSMDEISDSPVLLTETNLYIYNSSAYAMVSEQHGLSSPFIACADNELLLSQRGGNMIKIINTSGIEHIHTTDKPIIDMDIVNGGVFGTATQSEDYQGSLTIYKQNSMQGYDRQFRWSSASSVITDLSISPDNSKVIAASVNSIDGIITSYIHIFDIFDGSELFKGEYSDEMILETDFKDGVAVFISDNAVRSIDISNFSLNEYEFDNKNLYSYDIESADNIAVALTDYSASQSITAYLLDEDANPVFDTKAFDEISMISVYEDGMYVVCENEIVIYSDDLEKTETIQTELGKKAVIIDRDLYYSTPTHIYSHRMS